MFDWSKELCELVDCEHADVCRVENNDYLNQCPIAKFIIRESNNSMKELYITSVRWNLRTGLLKVIA